jgi:hypothetical protein
MFRAMERLIGMKTLTTVAFLTLAATTSLAQAEDMPKPIADLEKLVGTWKGGGTATMGKDSAKISASWTCKRTSAKAGVLCQLKVTGIPGVTMEETDLFGYEPSTNTYHWFSVTNLGETHDHVAKVTDDPKLQFVFTGTQEGKPFKEVIDVEFAKDAKSFALRSESFVAGASVAVFDVKAKK